MYFIQRFLRICSLLKCGPLFHNRGPDQALMINIAMSVRMWFKIIAVLYDIVKSKEQKADKIIISKIIIQ